MPEHPQLNSISDSDAIAQDLRLQIEQDQQAEAMSLNMDTIPNKDVFVNGAEKPVSIPKTSSLGIARQTESMESSTKLKNYYGGRESLTDEEVAQSPMYSLVMGLAGGIGQFIPESKKKDAAKFLGAGKEMEFSDLGSWKSSAISSYRYKLPAQMMLELANETEAARNRPAPFTHDWFEQLPEGGGGIGEVIVTGLKGLKDTALRHEGTTPLPSLDMVEKRQEYGIKVDELRAKAAETMDKHLRAGLRDKWLHEEDRSMIHVLGDAYKSVAEFVGITYAAGGNPMAGAAFFGGIQQLDSYQELIDKGVPHEEALQNANVKAGVTAISTTLGGSVLYKGLSTPSKSFVKQVLKGSVSEGSQEAGESIGHDVVDILFGVGDKDFGEILKSAGQAGSIGILSGGPISGGAKVIQDSRVQGRLMEVATQENAAGLLAQGLVDARTEQVNQARSDLIATSPVQEGGIFEGPLKPGDTDPILTLLDEVLNMMSIEGEIMEDSMIPDSDGGPQTAPGKEARRLRKESSKLIESFLKLEGIEPVMSKAQKAKFERDTINRMRGMTAIEKSMGADAAIKDLEGKAKVLSDKMDALEAKGEELLAKESSKVDAEGKNFPVFVEVDTKQAKKLREDLENIAQEISDIAQTRNDILKDSGLLSEELLEGQTVSEKLGRIVGLRKNKEIKAFKKGIKGGEAIAGKRASELASAVNKAIDSMPLSQTAKNKLKNSVPAIQRASDLDASLDVLTAKAVSAFIKEQTKSNLSTIKTNIVKNKPKGDRKGNDAKFNTLLVDMSKMTKKSADELLARDPQEVKDELSERYESGQLADMHIDYANITAKGEKSGLMATTAFLDNLNFLTELGHLPTELSMERQAQVAETLRKVDTGKLLADKDFKRQDTVYSNPFERLASGFANWAMTTYHSKLVRLGLHEDKTFNTEQGEMNARDTRGALFEKLIEINERLGLDVKKDLVEWNNPDNDYDSPEDLSSGQVESWVSEAESLPIAKAIAKKYLVTDKGLREEIELAETIEDVLSIVSKGDIDQKAMDVKHFSLSKAEAIYTYALLQNEAMRKQLMNPLSEDAWTQSRIDSLEAFVKMDEKSDAWVSEIFGLMEEVHTMMKPFWERKFGVVMPKVDNYMPVLRDPKVKKVEDGNDGSSLGMFGDTAYLGDLTPGFSKNRIESRTRVKNSDVLRVVEDYIREAAWFMHMGEQVDSMKLVMAHRDFGNHMTQRLGEKGYASFKDTVSQYEKDGGMPEANPAPSAVRWAHTAFMRYALGYKPQIGIKQTSSLFGFMEEVPTEYFLLRLAQTPHHMARWRKELREHSTIKNRGRHFDHEWSIMRGDNKLGAYGQRNKIGESSVFFGKAGDVTAIYIGGGIMFDYLTQERGMSKEDALKKIASHTEQSQQSTLQIHKTPLQSSKNPMIKMLGMFKTSPTAQNNMIAKAYYKFKRGEITKIQFAKSVYIFHVMVPSIFTWMGLGLIPNEDEQLKALMMGNTGGIPLAGDALSFVAGRATEGMTGGDVKSFPLGSKAPLEEFASTVFKTGGTLKDVALSEGDVTEMELIQATADLLGFATSTGAGNISEMIQGMYGIGEYNEYQDWQKLMGFSEGTIEQGLESENK